MPLTKKEQENIIKELKVLLLTSKKFGYYNQFSYFETVLQSITTLFQRYFSHTGDDVSLQRAYQDFFFMVKSVQSKHFPECHLNLALTYFWPLLNRYSSYLHTCADRFHDLSLPLKNTHTAFRHALLKNDHTQNTTHLQQARYFSVRQQLLQICDAIYYSALQNQSHTNIDQAQFYYERWPAVVHFYLIDDPVLLDQCMQPKVTQEELKSTAWRLHRNQNIAWLNTDVVACVSSTQPISIAEYILKRSMKMYRLYVSYCYHHWRAYDVYSFYRAFFTGMRAHVDAVLPGFWATLFASHFPALGKNTMSPRLQRKLQKHQNAQRHHHEKIPVSDHDYAFSDKDKDEYENGLKDQFSVVFLSSETDCFPRLPPLPSDKKNHSMPSTYCRSLLSSIRFQRQQNSCFLLFNQLVWECDKAHWSHSHISYWQYSKAYYYYGKQHDRVIYKQHRDFYQRFGGHITDFYLRYLFHPLLNDLMVYVTTHKEKTRVVQDAFSWGGDTKNNIQPHSLPLSNHADSIKDITALSSLVILGRV